ncbi:hypothetical protein [Planktothrix sp. FACHB-1365]|uniref:hypothetical protein n=1 Tax=Planktothrix sp. FACHB-1365 TaxID=2692855 RepID=UPI0016822F8D|nr:hypothetical protein [Planktothrix sp. FACHB-1365]MBD2483821.1 hypothetical protein [Planktothrix sp. FACHB-1365]
MGYNSLPQEPEKRRVIMVFSRVDLKDLELEGSELFRKEQVSLLEASTTENSPLVEKLRGSGLLNPGSVLIQSPYDPSNYADALDASYAFAQAKCVHFATLCGLLAARKVSVKQMEIQTAESQTIFSGNLNTPYGGGGGEGRRRAWERMKKAVSLEREYGEGEPKLDAARAYLSKHQWLTDAHLNSFLDLREAGIPIETENFSVSLTKESEKNLKIVFSLNLPQNIAMNADLKAQFEQIKKESYEFNLDVIVQFW